MKAHTIFTLIVVGLVVLDLIGVPMWRTFSINSPGYEGVSWEEFHFWSRTNDHYFSQGGWFPYLALLLGGNLLIGIVNWARRHPA